MPRSQVGTLFRAGHGDGSSRQAIVHTTCSLASNMACGQLLFLSINSHTREVLTHEHRASLVKVRPRIHLACLASLGLLVKPLERSNLIEVSILEAKSIEKLNVRENVWPSGS